MNDKIETDLRKNKKSSYQKLKEKYKDLYKIYYNARKRLHELGQGVDEDDILLDFDMKL